MTARHQIRVGGRRIGRDRSPIDATRAPSVGDLLFAAREKKGVDLYRAERDTKIRSRHLAALEAGDFGDLLGSVYTKGFLRNYAVYLGLDPDELLEKWRDELEGGPRDEAAPLVRPPQPLVEPRRGLTLTPGLLVAAVLAAIVLLFAGYVGIQVLRWSQDAVVTLDGPAIRQLAGDAQTVSLSGTSAVHATVNISDGAGHLLETALAGDDGKWAAEVPVTRGENDFSIVARDPDTGKDSPALPAVVLVALPGATAHPTAAPPGSAPPAATFAPGGTATPGAATSPVVPLTAAQLTVTAPDDGARVAGPAVAVAGTSDATAVRVTATFLGPVGGQTEEPGRTPNAEFAPTPPQPVLLGVANGVFRGRIAVAPGRWAVTVRTLGGGGVTASDETRTVDVTYGGVVVTIAAQGGPALIQVTVDGKVVEAGRIFHRGDSRTFTGRHSVTISTDNASVTVLTVNGEPKGALGRKAAAGTWVIERGKEPRALQ